MSGLSDPDGDGVLCPTLKQQGLSRKTHFRSPPQQDDEENLKNRCSSSQSKESQIKNMLYIYSSQFIVYYLISYVFLQSLDAFREKLHCQDHKEKQLNEKVLPSF